MKEGTAAKLIGAVGLVVLLVAIGAAWLAGDLLPDRSAFVAVKLAALLGGALGVALVAHYFLIRGWISRLKLLESFVSSFPDSPHDLSDGGPADLEDFTRAMRGMSRRIKSVIDHAGLELGRRETILACMAEGVLAVDAQLRVTLCNDAFAKAFGTRAPGAETRPLYEVVREPALREILERVARSGNPETDRFQLPSAAGRWFEARTVPLGQAPNRGAVIVLHDVTDLQHHEQVRKDFVADVSHELRTPLAAIRGYAETLLDGALEDKENNRRFVEIILSHTVRLANIAADLLVLSELDSVDRASPPSETIKLQEVVESAINTVASAARIRGISIDHDCSEARAVIGYRFRLEQVMVNLLDNAVKFSRPEGKVEIVCGPPSAGYVSVSVIDSGIGIPQQDLKRIFERFYRVDKARSRPVGGTGLGLPIVKHAMELMGGSVTVESQLGRGSKFTIVLRAA